MAKGTLVVDHSNASLSGASQALVSEDATRQFLMIQNESATNYIAVNLTGGVAALNTGGSVTIPPLKALIISEGFIPTNAITVIGTAGDDVTCYTNP